MRISDAGTELPATLACSSGVQIDVVEAARSRSRTSSTVSIRLPDEIAAQVVAAYGDPLGVRRGYGCVGLVLFADPHPPLAFSKSSRA